MPCYFNKMIGEYFVSQPSDIQGHINDLDNSLDVRSNLLYDFIDSTVYYFGPPSYDATTPDINKITFEMWKQEVYAMVTNEVDMDNLSEIELSKCRMFWDTIEQHNLLSEYITANIIENVFNQSPVSYQRNYIEILETENADQPYAENISDSDHENPEDDYTAEEALNIINEMPDCESDDETENVTENVTDDDTIYSESENDTETDNDDDVEEDIFSSSARAPSVFHSGW